MMLADALRPAQDRWCDVAGTPPLCSAGLSRSQKTQSPGRGSPGCASATMPIRSTPPKSPSHSTTPRCNPPRQLPSVTDLINAIRRYIDGWDDRCRPFIWTKTAEEILEHATPKKRKETSFTRY